MLKHLMNGSSLLALALRDAENENGADPKAALRAQLAKGNIPESENNGEQNADGGSDNEGDGAGEEEESEEDEPEGTERCIEAERTEYPRLQNRAASKTARS